ncbi:olfactory receptor 13C2-like [Scophthalmus maximus]|uniref:Olfactory receptor n=1 Tax=Scophthalmus maximus TaxID=52904 RepID=A0A8D3ADT4_SCOMX|nr:olfactory receptor 13C2-like [Scophthalmus maximus]
MAAEFNVTYITLEGHVRVEKYRYFYFMIMLFAYILIICCNATIVCLIVIHLNLHEPMYIFIAALLLNSVLLSTVIYPKLLIDFLSEKQIISYSACLFQCFLYYSLSSSEFLLLSVMAYDRYVSICKPMEYPTIMTRTTVGILLVVAWILPACQTAVPVVGNIDNRLCTLALKGIFCNNSVNHLYCVTSRALSIYGIVVLVNLVFFPMFFILFTYTKILIISFRSGEVRKKAAQTCMPHLLVLINYSCLITYDVIIVKLESDFPKVARFVMTMQIIIYNPILNPIIYGLKMKEISKHLKCLLSQVKVN